MEEKYKKDDGGFDKVKEISCRWTLPQVKPAIVGFLMHL